MTGSRTPIQLAEVRDDRARSGYELLEIRLRLHHDGFVLVLEEMPDALWRRLKAPP